MYENSITKPIKIFGFFWGGVLLKERTECNGIYLNPSTLEVETGLQFKASLGKKVSKTLSSKTTWVWWVMPVIPASPDGEVGELQSEAGPVKSKRLYLKNKLK
jgi:hypothetical protein